MTSVRESCRMNIAPLASTWNIAPSACVVIGIGNFWPISKFVYSLMLYPSFSSYVLFLFYHNLMGGNIRLCYT